MTIAHRAAMACLKPDLRASCRDVWIGTDLLSYSPEVDDNQSGATSPNRDELPERRVTPNMLAAFNMTYFRRVSGLTQEQLGEHLGGWTKTAVSAAERSWDGKRIRQFDADLIADLATILGVPIAAFFLPPPDDGLAFRYVVDSDHDPDEGLPVREFFAYVTSDPVDDGKAAMRAYEDRLVAAVNRYHEPGVAEALDTRLRERATEVQLSTALLRARESGALLWGMEDAVRDMKEDYVLLSELLVTMLRATPEGLKRLEEMDRAERRRGWEDMSAQARKDQQAFARIWHEMFGDRPGTQDEATQVVAEGRKRGVEGVPWTRKRLIDGKIELVTEPHEGGGGS